MKLTVIGCSDAFGSGGRYHSCYALETSKGRILLDCGANAPLGLKRAGLAASSFDAVAISHCHGDHFGGLPFLFLNRLFVEDSSKPLEILGPPGIRERSESLLECMYPSLNSLPRCFDVTYRELTAGSTEEWRGLPISAYAVDHFSGSPSLALSFLDEGRRFSFSGDSAWCEGVVQAGRDAELYLIECTAFDEPSKVHLDYQTLSANFDRIGSMKYLLTHMSEPMLASLCKIDKKRCIPAEDGLTLTIGED